MAEDKFSFGRVKGINMLKALNEPMSKENFVGLKYLCYQFEMAESERIKNEIEYCFKNYAADYIIQFGKYRGQNLKKIYEMNRSYIETYLANNDNSNIRTIIKYFLTYKTDGSRNEYNSYQQQTYDRYAELKARIDASRINEIESVVRSLGYEIQKGKFAHCPWSCDKNSKDFRHASIVKGKDGSYIVACYKCNNGNGRQENLIKFVCDQKKYNFKQSIEWIVGILGINLNLPLGNGITPEKREFIKPEEEMVFQNIKLEEISTDGFGFNEGVYPPILFERGFTAEEAAKMEVYFAGRDCTNKYKNRLCFLVRDLDNRLVGVVGRNKFSEEEHYNYWIKKLDIDSGLDREQQIDIVNSRINKYIKYYNSEGFKAGNTLYNANRLDKNSNEIFLVEGPFDVMKMVLKHGYPNAAGMFKSIISDGQLYQLFTLYKEKRKEINVFLFIDNDKTGEATFEKNLKKLQEVGFANVYKMVLRDAKDAGEATKEQVEDAYANAILQPVKYSKKKIIIDYVELKFRVTIEE